MNWPLVICVLAGGAGLALLLAGSRAGVLATAPPTGGRAGKRLPVAPISLLGAAVGAAIGWAVVGGALSLAIGAAAGFGASVWLTRQPAALTAAQHTATQQFPLVLEFLAAVIDSGAPVRFAAEVVAAVADDHNAGRLRSVLARCDVGFSDAEAWRTLADDPLWGHVAREVARCVDTGAAVADILRNAALQASKSAAATATAQARSTGVASTLPLVVCFLPAFLLVGVVPIIGGLIGNYLAGG